MVQDPALSVGFTKARPSTRAIKSAEARRLPRSERGNMGSNPAGPCCLAAACHRSSLRTLIPVSERER